MPRKPGLASPDLVYAIGSSVSPLVKIGHSNKVTKRLADVQRMSPVPLSVLWTTEGGSTLESALHRRFSHLRAYGEWFDFGDSDPVSAIAEAAAEMTLTPAERQEILARLAAIGARRVENDRLLAELSARSVAAAKSALLAGMRPSRVARALGYTDSYIRRLAREVGVPPR